MFTGFAIGAFCYCDFATLWSLTLTAQSRLILSKNLIASLSSHPQRFSIKSGLKLTTWAVIISHVRW